MRIPLLLDDYQHRLEMEVHKRLLTPIGIVALVVIGVSHGEGTRTCHNAGVKERDKAGGFGVRYGMRCKGLR